MSLFDGFFEIHSCKWTEESRHFIEPASSRNAKGDAKMILKVLNGYTVIVQKCKECGKLDSVEIMGNATDG